MFRYNKRFAENLRGGVNQSYWIDCHWQVCSMFHNFLSRKNQNFRRGTYKKILPVESSLISPPGVLLEKFPRWTLEEVHLVNFWGRLPGDLFGKLPRRTEDIPEVHSWWSPQSFCLCKIAPSFNILVTRGKNLFWSS